MRVSLPSAIGVGLRGERHDHFGGLGDFEGRTNQAFDVHGVRGQALLLGLERIVRGLQLPLLARQRMTAPGQLHPRRDSRSEDEEGERA